MGMMGENPSSTDPNCEFYENFNGGGVKGPGKILKYECTLRSYPVKVTDKLHINLNFILA